MLTNSGAEKKAKNNSMRNFAKKNGNLLIFLFIWIFASIFIKNFATLSNNINILSQSAVAIVACLGMTFVLMTGGIDLSLGYTLGFCSYIYGLVAVQWNLPVVVALVCAIAVGGLCGLLNGLLVQIAKIPAFIVTLGTGYIIYGIAQIASNGAAITNLDESVLAIGRTKILGLTTIVYIALAVVIISYFILHRSTYGRALSAVGMNIEASRLSGIKTDFTVIMAYVYCGLCTGLSAVLMATRVNNCVSTLGGTEFTFRAITAAILGGASLFGGIGTAWGSVLGVLTIYGIENCLGLLGVNSYMYTAVLSIIILIAIIFENVKNRMLQ